MTFAELRRRASGRRHARLQVLAGAFAFVLAASDANALFIVNQPWVSPARKAQTTNAYMNLASTGGATLLGAQSDAARRVTIHSARAAEIVLALPAKSVVALVPGHAHLTLTGLTRALEIGDRVKIILTVRDDDGAVHEVDVNAEVRIRSPIDDERRAHHHR
jgi:copper(I)-binding protein